MAKFGICTGPDQATAVRAAGWDYIEGSAQALFQGLIEDDAQWTGADAARAAALPVPSANGLVPPELKLVGPDVDADRVAAYLARVIRRAGALGTRTLVFGSGAARNVPAGFDRARAREQILAFLRRAMPDAQAAGVTLVIEPLNGRECNVLNTVAEAADYVRAVDHPNLRCLVDTFHFWTEREPLANLAAAMPVIAHVHVADEHGRVAPGQSGRSDYRPLFRVLKDGGYDGLISVEAGGVTPETYAPTLAFLRREWAAA